MLAKSKLNSIEVLISMALIDLNISHDDFILINNVLKEYDHMKEEIKNVKTYLSFGLSSRQFIEDFSLRTMLSYFLNCRKNTERKNLKLLGQKTEE